VSEAARIVVDHLIVVCKGCRIERTIYPDVPLVGSDALISWMSNIEPCSCGAKTCDVKAHLQDAGVRT
jgi:hypothetical protein